MRQRDHTRPARAPARSDEELLTAHALAGDRDAFAALYERYERRVYNVCYRILGSPEEAADATQDAFANVLRRLPRMRGRELSFGSYVFKAARNASYDTVKRRGAVQLTDAVADTAVSVTGDDPVEDPARRLLLAAQQESLRRANARLPVRQREVLALRALGELSYDEIAAIMGMNRNSVAQLLSRARLRLRIELRGAAGEAIVAAGEECAQALPLLAMADDNELHDDRQALWLRTHLTACSRCELAQEVMAEAGESYRSWLPLVAIPWLLDAAEAKAAERAHDLARRRRRRGVRSVAAAAAVVLATAGIAATTGDSSTPPAAPPARVAAAVVEVPTQAPERPAPTRTPEPTATPARTAEPTPEPTPTSTPSPTPTPPEATPTPEPKRTSRPRAAKRTPEPARTPAAVKSPESTPTPEPPRPVEPTTTPDPTPTAEPTPTVTPDPTPDPPCRRPRRCPGPPTAGTGGFQTPQGSTPPPQ